jgi:2'-5' RNA ligase
MRFTNYLTEAKWMSHPMIGFGVNPADIKQTMDYIERELIHDNIKWKESENHHLTISQFFGKFDKADLIRATNSIETNLVFKPIKIDIFRGKRVKKDFIVIMYKANKKYVDDVEKLSDEFEGAIQWEHVIPHVSLFTVKRGAVSDELIKSISDHAPKLKPIKPTEVQLWNAKHQKEYVK